MITFLTEQLTVLCSQILIIDFMWHILDTSAREMDVKVLQELFSKPDKKLLTVFKSGVEWSQHLFKVGKLIQFDNCSKSSCVCK